MHDDLKSTAASQLFTATVAPYLVLDTNLCIQAANPAYLRVTGRRRDELVGVSFFEAFPDNPADPDASGVRNLAVSLDRVLRQGVPDDMPVQRYDIPDATAPGTFRPKTWSVVNSPLTDHRGRVVGVLHHAEDIGTTTDSLLGAGLADSGDGEERLRRAVLTVARCQAASNDVPPVDLGRRDELWHRIVHAARHAGPKGCAAAVCDAALRELPGIEAAAITLRGRGLVPHQLAATDPWADRAEELQLIVGGGPATEAFESGEPVLVPAVAGAGAPWSAFADAAQGMGISAIFVFPLRTATGSVGTLTLYSRGADVPVDQLRVDAGQFAELATITLLAD
ncbi:MAG TPA: PAS domain-containing protein, partial [Pseudonocardiaceae bacterium]|nr:PAS domain-containing protein [Pseudonocardiaceae bacterium]